MVRVEAHARLLISNDISFSPSDVVVSTGDKSIIDSTTYNLADSHVMNLVPSASSVAMPQDGVAMINVLMITTPAETVSVTIVPTGVLLSACSPLLLLANCPLVIGANIGAIYFSNSDANNSAQVHIGFAGN